MGCTFSMFDCALCEKREQLLEDGAIWFSDLAALEATEASSPGEAAMADTDAPIASQASSAPAGRRRVVTFAPDLVTVFTTAPLDEPMAEIEVVADLPETCAASRDPLRLLPSEVLIRIVSLLDDESLLRISMASPKLADVSRHQPVVRRRIEKQIALEMAKVEEDSDACKDLWSYFDSGYSFADLHYASRLGRTSISKIM
ncbi:uncharacterized protein LOC126346516 isoform X2 [Schistocerca gregaria]|uniref:uncharacterized protein LOC126346516 isoform X2 n=1 Tax=Schistocerca gregaria TaxID=7010 RepID=UPI00211DD3C6|nr:uncharacterized protein LOC126346516 isoform X2 [Schistocerca gregaria]